MAHLVPWALFAVYVIAAVWLIGLPLKWSPFRSVREDANQED